MLKRYAATIAGIATTTMLASGLLAPPASAQGRIIYKCPTGVSLQVWYKGNRVTVYYGSERFDLRRKRSASGVLWQGRDVTVHEKGERAHLAVRNGVSVNCHRKLKVKARPIVLSRSVWRCKTGQVLRAAYYKNRMVMRIGVEQFNLRQVRSGSGSRYKGRGISFHEKGFNAALQFQGGIRTVCSRSGRGVTKSPTVRRTVAWGCQSGTNLRVTYIGNKVIIRIGSERFDLVQTPGASGARYASRGTVFHEDGKGAFFHIKGGQRTVCSRR